MNDNAATFTLDQLDQRIVAMLRQDARITNKAIAAELNVAESTIGTRIRGLEDRNIMRVVAMRDVRALGYDILAHVTVDVRGRDPVEVARELAEINAVTVVTVSAGAPQIVINVMARERNHLTQIITREIGHIRGIQRLESLISLQIFKFVSEFSSFQGNSPQQHDDHSLDIKDRILRLVERDARLSNREIARTLGTSEANVRKWLKTFATNGAMKLGTMIDPRALGLNCAAFLRFNVEPAHIESVARAISQWDEFSFASVTSGAYDVFGVATVENRGRLAQLVNAKAALLPGVIKIDVIEHVDVIKMAYNMVRILDSKSS